MRRCQRRCRPESWSDTTGWSSSLESMGFDHSADGLAGTGAKRLSDAPGRGPNDAGLCVRLDLDLLPDRGGVHLDVPHRVTHLTFYIIYIISPKCPNS